MALSSLQSFTLSSRSSVSTNCDNGFFVSVLGSRGPHRILWPSLRKSCSTKLLCAKSNSEGGVSTSAPAMEEQSSPIISLRFIGPEVGDEEATTSVVSGEKLLRTIILDNKLELYGLYGKVMNCGGGGSCGTCIVEILEGKDLLNERTDAEYKFLKKKPETWRLSCQTIVGDKSNSGEVVVQRLPQKKKK
ncbi:hypothetical protein CY35_04G075700 [Sphagnum magellanicum]|nr:hypothetical protein CY35_04G075700 [Sphagnum magellanicum]